MKRPGCRLPRRDKAELPQQQNAFSSFSFCRGSVGAARAPRLGIAFRHQPARIVPLLRGFAKQVCYFSSALILCCSARIARTMEVIRSSSVRPGARVQPLKVSVSICCLAQVNSRPCASATVKFNAMLEGAILGGAVLPLSAGAALRSSVEPVEAAICLAEKARMTARARSIAALFIITFLLACAGIPAAVEGSSEGATCSPGVGLGPRTALDFARISGYRVSNIAHNIDI